MENSVIEVGRLIYAKGHLIGARSGLIVALAGVDATGILAAIRNIGPEELIVDSLEMGFFTTTVATTPFPSIAFAAYRVANFTALPTGGRVTAPRPLRKRVGDCFELLPAVDPAAVRNQGTTFVEVTMANTAALTATTFTAPAYEDPIAQAIFQGSGNGAYGGLAKHEPKNLIPWTLAPNEGLIFTSQVAFPAALTGRFSIGADVRIA